MLEVRDLACSRNETQLFSKLTFLLSPGTAMQIKGANGVGKTTLLKTLAGLLAPSYGCIVNKSSILYLGHKNNFHPALSVIDNLKFLSILQTVNGNTLNSALQFCGLSAQRDVVCESLSAGQLQRLNLARLYLSTAELWLLDEPLINCDTQAKQLLQMLCQQHLQQQGMLIFTAHNDFNLAQTVNIDLSAYA